MYIKAPLVVLLLSAIPSLALPVDNSNSVTARFASAESSSLEARNPCIQKAKRTCDGVKDPGCIQNFVRTCDRIVEEEPPAKRTCDTPGCIQTPPKKERREETEGVDKRTCDTPGCIQVPPKEKREETEAVNKRTCDTPGCIQTPPPPKTDELEATGCIQRKGKRTCDKL
ncbi:hypothetical protein NKR19_g1108 [Coniochaeta hoffmannii]|uniref:Uncharacterized protein n=1 Tax=Coniochaeta hoffmannii TaxID=91930 RepID=A0AA38SCU0_9PEZI|nr:hypothetical protein NKR19_g1108 [Coniochaeta hoffmannii]